MTSPTAIEVAVGDFLDHMRVERGASANTLAAYGRDLRRYSKWCAQRGIGQPQQITENLISDYVIALRTGSQDWPALAASSAGRAVVAVRGFHKFIAREGVVATDPSRDIKPPTTIKALPKAISYDDVEAILHASGGDRPADDPLALRDRALLEFLYGTGARISEAVGLVRDDLDTAHGVVLLRGKGDKHRLVPVGGKALAALDSYLIRSWPALRSKGRDSRHVFLNARGGVLSRQSAWAVLRDAAARAGISAHVSPHTMRHSFATHLLDGGADVRVVQELLGHASVTTTQVYTMVNPDRLKEIFATAHPRARR